MNNMLLLPKNKIKKAFFTSIVIYILLYCFWKNNFVYISYTIRAIFIILSFILFIILNKVNCLKNEYIYTCIKNFLIMISIVGFLGISTITKISSLYERNTYVNMTIHIIIFLEILSDYIFKEYYINKNKHINILYLTDAFLVIILAIHMNYINYLEVFIILKIIFVIIQVIICLHIYKSIRITNKFKHVRSRLDILYILLISFIECINIIFSNFDLLDIILEIVCIFNFFMFFTIVITKHIEKPYEHLIKILQNENSQLDNLNIEIIKKNKDLERLNIILKQREELNYTFFRFMPNPIILLNSKNNRIIFVNDRFLELAEITEAREIINSKIKKHIEFVSYSEEDDFDAILYVGSKRKYLKTKFVVKYESDYMKLIVVEDNTEKVEIREMRKEVEKRKRNEKIRSQFLSSISHDLKTPINVIYSGLQLEQIYIEKGQIEALKKYNEISRQNCISLTKLTNNLIDNSKISSDFITANLKRNNIVKIIEEQVLSYVDYAMWNGIELIFDTNTEECMIYLDVEFMARIILNLISNSVKYTPQNGKIFVTVEEKQNSVLIKVKDTGCGIDKELKDKIFNRYTSSNKAIADSKSGTGLGLFVVKNLVELQNGIIYLEDKEIGTSIVIKLKKGEAYV